MNTYTISFDVNGGEYIRYLTVAGKNIDYSKVKETIVNVDGVEINVHSFIEEITINEIVDGREVEKTLYRAYED